MTFDDGILTVYKVDNIAEPGDKPVQGLTAKASYFYGYDRLGITRYYTALEANQQIEAVVNVPEWTDIKISDVAIMDEQPDVQYQINLVQPETDENGLRIMKLTLERMNQKYEIPEVDISTAQGGTSDSDG